MVGITIQYRVNLKEKPIGISFRGKDELAGELIWSVFEQVSLSKSKFNELDTLIVTVHSVRMPVVFDKCSIKSIGKPLCHGTN